MIVINLLGEPGSGKSVTAAGLYHQLAILHHNVTLVPEIAKKYAWETPIDNQINNPIFEQQLLLLGEQNRLLESLRGKVDIAIMECPLLLCEVYQKKDYYKSFSKVVTQMINTYNNINIVIDKNHKFDEKGRVHNEKQAKKIKKKLIKTLDKRNINYVRFKTGKNIIKEIVKYLKKENLI